VSLAAAGASFEHVDGCVATTVHVTAVDQQARGDDAAAYTLQLAEVFFERYDRCAGVDLLRGSETGDQAVEVRIRGLDGAELSGSLVVHDFVSGTDLVLDVDVSWHGTGAVTTTATADGQRQWTRPAAASGTLVLAGEPLVGGTAQSAALERIVTRLP
jgi:hypothetical protein